MTNSKEQPSENGFSLSSFYENIKQSLETSVEQWVQEKTEEMITPRGRNKQKKEDK